MEKELPKNWVLTNIEAICSVGSSKRIYKNEYSDEGTPFYRSKEIIEKSRGINPKIELFINFDKYQSLKQKYGSPESGDILLTAVGTIGISYVVKNEPEFYFKDGNLIWFKNIVNGIDPKYLKFWLDSESGQERLQEGSIGSNQRALTIRGVKEVKFPLPPLAEQHRIVAKLDALFGHLEQVKTRLANIPQLLKNFRQAILTQAVTGKLTEQWREGKELGDGIERLKQLKNIKPIKGKNKWIDSDRLSQPGHLQSWFKCYLHDVLDLMTDGSHHSPKLAESGFPYITVRDISWNNTIDIENSKRISKDDYQELVKNGCKPVKGDVLFSKDGTVGKVFLLKEEFDMVVLSSLAILRPIKNYCSSEYLSLLMMSPLILDQALGKKTGTAIRRIVLKHLKEVEAYFPTLIEQTEIVSRVESLLAKADAIEAKYKTLKAQIDNLPQAILAKAFKGELVEQLPTDGNAKDLLEEIKKLKEEVPTKKQNKRINKKTKSITTKSKAQPKSEYPLYSILLGYEKGLNEEKLFSLAGLSQHSFLIQLDIELELEMVVLANNEEKMIKYNPDK